MIFLDSSGLKNRVRVNSFDSLVAFEIADVERHNLPNAGGFHDGDKSSVVDMNATYPVLPHQCFPCGIRTFSLVKDFEKSFQIGHFVTHFLNR